MGKEQFVARLAEKGIDLSPLQREQFEGYYRLLVEWNEKMNLTAITEEDEVYTKHFFDSVTPSFYFPFSSVTSIADIGAGAGFPSLPLKICFPHLEVTIVDSLQKRMTFINHVADQLGLTNVTAKHGRAEEVGQDPAFRERFDLVTARAVARLNVLSEFCLPFARTGGHFIAMKGSDIQLELQEAKKAIKTLGGKTKAVERFQLPDDAGERHLVFIEKVQSTPKSYPRKPGIPAKKPIL
jgi:16S rRNA (guanine527-N7)-methyltransferase